MVVNTNTDKFRDSRKGKGHRLFLKTGAPLQMVPMENYLRYGPEGVPHYGPGAVLPEPHPRQIRIRLTIKNAGGEILLSADDLVLKDSRPDEPYDLNGVTIWEYEESGKAGLVVQVRWIWDFYRVFSGLVLEVNTAIELAAADAAYSVFGQNLQETMPQLQAGHQIILEAAAATGDILIVYPVDNAPVSR